MSLKFRGLLAVTLAGLFAAPLMGQGLRPGMSWDWQLQAPLDLSVPVDVLDLDPDEVSATDITALRARGVFLICYISVGTWEDWRSDAGDFPQEVIGRAYEGWPGEHFLDIRAPQVLALMKARLQRCAAMGFQAVEPDNIDLNINETGFEIGAGDVVAYMKALADEAHRLGMAIGQKNAPDMTATLVPLMDFAITENCLTDHWCAELAAYPASSKPIFAAEYRPASQQECVRATALGLSLIFKREDLDSWCDTCQQN